MAVVALFLGACQGDPMNTPPGATGSLISTAINSDGVWKLTPLAVDASTSQGEYNLVLVTLSSAAGPAPQDIHVTLVPALDSLDNYNTANDTDFVMPGGVGTPAFELVDNGLVTIPKGSYYAYLKIKTTPNDYFGGTNYAFSYRIASVQEAGYTVVSAYNYSIVPFIAKNPWDAKYAAKGYFGHPSAPRDINDTYSLATVNATTIAMNVGDLGNIMNVQVNADNTLTITNQAGLGVKFFTAADEATVAYPGNVAKHPWSYYTNTYDPATKVFKMRYGYLGGTGWRTITCEYTRK